MQRFLSIISFPFSSFLITYYFSFSSFGGDGEEVGDGVGGDNGDGDEEDNVNEYNRNEQVMHVKMKMICDRN